jgi:RND family efflux transporter MFP subunit
MSESKASPVRRRKRRWGRWLVLFVIILAAGAYAGIARPWEPKPKLVAAETLRTGPVSQALAINGRVAAKTSVTVRAAVSGQALAVAADTGDRVEAGTVLVRLDSSLVDAQAEQARAALEAQQVRQRQAEATAERALALGENTARSNLEDAEWALAAAVNETARLEAALDQVERQIDQYTITAPIAGTVLSRGVDLGQLVDAQTELFVIADTSELLVETDVDELYSARVSVGLKALLQPVGASVPQHGTVTFAAPVVDSATGGRAIRISFDEPASLPVGQTVNANVIVDEVEEAISVPRGAIVTEGTDSHVLVIEDGRVASRAIEFSDWPAERVIVTAGLAAGDVVIIDPAMVAVGDMVEAE